MSKIIGIDLGTTNSLVAVVENGKPKIITDNGEKLIPSFVGYSKDLGIIVGTPAKNQYILDPDNTVKSIKRRMGTNDKITLGGQAYSPPEISAFILRKLKSMAENYLKEPVEKAVITVPAFFSDAQRQATKDAGEIAGLEVVRIINEPTAAALSYGLDDEDHFIVVYDLGGGTFDVSVIEFNSGVTEVLASHGNTQLGGDDFDQLLLDYIADEFKKDKGVDLRDNRQSLARLTRTSENAKIELSSKPYVQVTEEFIARKMLSSLHLDMEVAREKFEELIKDLLSSTVECINVALKEAAVESDQISKILMVGGSTRIPAVWRLVEERLNMAPHGEINPDECVALGAAIQAAIISGEETDKVIVDITPHSLGTDVVSFKFGRLVPDQYVVLIPRNTAIPVSKAERFWTLYPDQTAVRVRAFQGENQVASENTLLGEFLFENLGEPKKKGECREVVVQFDYDINGMVNVTALDRQSGKKKGITVKAIREGLTDEEMAQAKERVAIAESKSTEIDALLAKTDSLVPKIREEGKEKEADELVSLCDELKNVRAEANRARIEELMNKITEIIYDYEG